MGQTNTPRQVTFRIYLDGYDGNLYEVSASKATKSIINWDEKTYKALRNGYNYQDSTTGFQNDMAQDEETRKEIQAKNNAIEFMSRFHYTDFVSACLPTESSLMWSVTWAQRLTLTHHINLIKAQKLQHQQQLDEIENLSKRTIERIETDEELSDSEKLIKIEEAKAEKKLAKDSENETWKSRQKLTLMFEWEVTRNKGKFPIVKSGRGIYHEFTYAETLEFEKLLKVQYDENTGLYQLPEDVENAASINLESEGARPFLSIDKVMPKMIYAKDYSNLAKEAYDLTGHQKMEIKLSRKYVAKDKILQAEQEGYPKTSWTMSGGLSPDYNEKNLIWYNLQSKCKNKEKTHGSFLDAPTIYKGTEVIIVSDKTAPDLLVTVNNLGVIGLYISAVLVIGRLLRASMTWDASSVAFTELPNVDRIWDLFNDLYLVREMRLWKLEEDLVAQIVFLFRCPEALIKYTRHPIESSNEEDDSSGSEDNSKTHGPDSQDDDQVDGPNHSRHYGRPPDYHENYGYDDMSYEYRSQNT